MKLQVFKANSSTTGPLEESRAETPLFARFLGRGILTGLGLFGLFLILMAVIHFATPNLVGVDSYFHIKFAQVMREQGLLPRFIWLPLTILAPEHYYDHHFLYHVLLIPFTYGDLREGAKWAGIIFPAGAFVMGWVLLRGQQVPYAALWSLGFFSMAESFLYRLSMTRVQAISLLMLFLMLHVAMTRRYYWLLPLSFVYLWLYNGFPLVLAVVGSYVVARLIVEGRLVWQPLAYTVAGIILGIIINPYFPENAIFTYQHLWPKISSTTEVNVGQEWYPYNTWVLVENAWPSLALFLSGAFVLGLRGQRMNSATATLFLVAAGFGFLLFKSRRFIEYYPAFALLFGAMAWTPLLRSWLQEGLRWARVAPLVLALLIGFTGWSNIQRLRDRLQEDSTPVQRFEAASAWLQANTPAGSRVFQTDWDDFTQLYYHNTHNTYTLGLDPTYMQQRDPELYELWRDITRGWGENLGQTIRHEFGAEYAITDLDHEGFLDKAGLTWASGLEEVYRDEYAVIFRVTGE